MVTEKKKLISTAGGPKRVEFSRLIDLKKLPESGLSESYAASEEECHTLNERFGSLGLTSLKLKIKLAPDMRVIEGKNVHAFNLDANIFATLEHFMTKKPDTIKHEFQYVCLFDSDLPDDFVRLHEIESALEESIEVISGTTIDVGEIAAQEIALEIDLRPQEQGDSVITEGDGWQLITETSNECN